MLCGSSVEDYPKWMFWKRRRYVVAVLAFFGFFNVYALRVNLSIAIVAMTSNRSITLDNGTITYVSGFEQSEKNCVELNMNNMFLQTQDFDWDSKMQGYVLSSFFYGYITTQLAGGWLAARIGGKRVYGFGVFVTSLLTLITPFAAHSSVYLLLTVRVIEGVFEVNAFLPSATG